MKILGIHYGHNATVSLLKDGEIIFCQSEERFNGLKNSTGFPDATMSFVKNNYGNDFDYVVLPGTSLLSYMFLKRNNFETKRYVDFGSNKEVFSLRNIIKIIIFKYFPSQFSAFFEKRQISYESKLKNNKLLMDEAKNYFASKVGISKEKIVFLDHHVAHALASAFNCSHVDKTLIFTLDGEGDENCATVGVYDKGEYKVISRSRRFNSLGGLFAEVTYFLGMRPSEDEFKVMGMAPYAKQASTHVKRIVEKFQNLIFLDENLEFKAKITAGLVRYYLLQNLTYERFDNISAAIQIFLEKIVKDWIEGWVKKTGIKNIAIGGGVFMNVKMNQKIMEQDFVEKLFVMPSAGDESLVFGCCFFGYKKFCEENKINFQPKSINNLYLGNDYSDLEIDEYLKNSKYKDDVVVEKPENLEEALADLLAKNEIISRYCGRMEWGARALGNRSILANPSSRDSVRIINEMVKNRDFWMPFACSVLSDDFDNYFINNKKNDPYYMAVTYASTERGRKDLVAALHSYDFTGRPQLVLKEWNERYYSLILEFKKKTGIGGVLNTSFNLHGEPLVCSPEDALRTLINSGLKYLALGPYLIRKK